MSYVLKQMYNGVYGYSNPLTDEQALELLGKHKKGLGLFAEYPDDAPSPMVEEKPKEDCGCGKKKRGRPKKKKVEEVEVVEEEVVEEIVEEDADSQADT